MNELLGFGSGDSEDADHPNRRLKFKKYLLWCLLLILVLFGIRYCVNSHSKPHAAAPLPVVLAKVTSQNVPVYLQELGGVTPTYSVTVRTQINGLLMHVLFKEGQMVKAGDLIAEIDDRPYQAQLIEYEGQFARDKAQLLNAEIDLKRYQTLWKQDSISQQTLATQDALVKQLQGTLQLDAGLIQAIKVNLIYTKITSPIDGRIGLRLVDPGNYVQTTDTNGIAVINLLNPITVIFTIPEDNIPDVMAQINAHQPLSVQVYDREQTTLLDVGKLLTIDNQIDTSTGTVKLRATFQNDKNELFPNQFVNVRLLVKTLPNATIIPTPAIQYSSKGSYVYVLNADQTVSEKPIVTGITTDDNTTVKSGLTPGEQVVVEGADKLTDGAKVIEASKAAAHEKEQTSA